MSFGDTPRLNITDISVQERSCMLCKSVHAWIGLDAHDTTQNRITYAQMNKKAYFCKNLAEWFFKTEWHFTTLLAISINSIKHFPNNMDAVINQLLLTYPDKPEKQSISFFLSNSAEVCAWFRAPIKPEVYRLSLQLFDMAKLSDSNLPALHTLTDLSDWLDISTGQLDYLADLWRHDESKLSHFKHYHYHLSPKNNGGGNGNKRYRLIEAPKCLLKKIQSKIKNDIICYMSIDDAAHGFRTGRSCKTHAVLHVDKKYLVYFDISNCFQSIQWSSIYRLFRGLGYPEKISKYLTALCTHRCYMAKDNVFKHLDMSTRALLRVRHLPQGAPSSPALSNAVLIRLDRRLKGLAKSQGLTYSRYADDFVFSGNSPQNWQFINMLVRSICLAEGFVINDKKTRVARPHQKQKVTGITVNKKINVDRAYYDRLKAILTNCVRYGLESQNRSNHPHFKEHLLGCIQHVYSLNAVKGSKLKLLFENIE